MATTAPLHKNRTTTMGRIGNFLNTGGLFKDAVLGNKVYSEITPVTNLYAWHLPGGSGSWKDWTFDRILREAKWEPTGTNNAFGPTFHTYWFKVEINVPASFVGKEVHFIWVSQTEAALYDSEGNLLNAFAEWFREDYVISKDWQGGAGTITYYIEMPCNGLTGAGSEGINPPDMNKYYWLWRCEIGIFNPLIYKLVTDIQTLRDLADRLSNDHRGYQAMFCANEMVNLIIAGNHEKASQISDVFFADRAGVKAHNIVAMGHCHIDTAWLWPYDETKRKCARSWVAQLELMKNYPDFVFVCSQAQQFAWVKQYYPALYSRIKQSVMDGRFIPVGGCWVEMDGNLPSGESFIRQFYYGQKFFQSEFNVLCKEFWLPDTFGYSAQIPQIMKHVGVTRFLTQKMSWNMVDRFPHHNFWWEGIDGTQVLVHFPPGANFNMTGAVGELLDTVNNVEDKGRTNTSIYLFGVGDGGGGPTKQMIERQNRVKDLDGMPRITFAGTDYFFEKLEQEGNKLLKWVGELYLEKHNGTYTSQAKIKWYNRKGEFFFREVEHLMTLAYVHGQLTLEDLIIDQGTLDENWKQFLLNQFHDVLPGTSIELVNIEVIQFYEAVFIALKILRDKYNRLLLEGGTDNFAIFNPLDWDVETVVFTHPDNGYVPPEPYLQTVTLDPDGTDYSDATEGRYKVPNTFSAALVNLKAGTHTILRPMEATTNAVVYSETANTIQITNGLVRVEASRTGLPYEEIYFTGSSGVERKIFNDRLNTGIHGGMFYYYDDVPVEYDAWDVLDYHLETRREPGYRDIEPLETLANGPLVGAYKFRAKFGNGSSLTRYTILRANSPMVEYYTVIDWKEEHKMLKVEFPVDVLSREAKYEVQFGFLSRPTHMNTSWDMAKFEVPGHKWMDFSQDDLGVSIITDSKYGWHTRDNVIKLSLLRSPRNPDANCDVGKHFVYYAVLPHEGSFIKADVVRKAHELNYLGANNVPLLNTVKNEAGLAPSLVKVDNAAVIVSAVKPLTNPANNIVVRLYESQGGTADVNVTLGFTVKSVTECDGLENPGDLIPSSGNAFSVSFKPFQVRTFRVSF